NDFVFFTHTSLVGVVYDASPALIRLSGGLETSSPDTRNYDLSYLREHGATFSADLRLYKLPFSVLEGAPPLDWNQFLAEGVPGGGLAGAQGTFRVTPNPEPATWTLLLAALPGLWLVRRRRAAFL